MTMTREPATSPATRTALSATARRAGKHALAQRIPPPALSRVSAWDWMAQLALLPIGYTLAGPLASAAGARSTLAIGCLIGIVLLASASVVTVSQGARPGPPSGALPTRARGRGKPAWNRVVNLPVSQAVHEIEVVVREHFRIVSEGELEAMDGNVTADFLNIRSAEEPVAARRPGPDGLRATSLWLRDTFADLGFEIHDIVIDGDRVAALVTMRARQHGTFLVYDDQSGKVTDAFPSKGRTLAVKQTHWFRIRDGKISEHDAVRDDLGMAKQLGWLPPTPAYLVRMLLAFRRERRRQRRHTCANA